MGIHWQELIVILLIVLVLFGPKRLPEIGSSLGRSIHGFRNSLNGLDVTKADQPSAVVAATEAAPVAVPAPVEVVATHDAPANPTAH